ncbi:hypothetical protein [Yinghuangia seranimata]|uniref:hypothetical protein n=1 Tax=Yinghuangia seranimata TaxID=408067 RepID=UPI00248CCF76|nr:hypothetical protein [Yinghuangia seranimata]MDI2125855.1 hypothetical protein [Yinghuangia seranimata]
MTQQADAEVRAFRALVEMMPRHVVVPVIDRAFGGAVPGTDVPEGGLLPGALVEAVVAHGRGEHLAAVARLRTPVQHSTVWPADRPRHLRRLALHRIAERVAADPAHADVARAVYVDREAAPRTRRLLARGVHAPAFVEHLHDSVSVDLVRPLLATGDHRIALRLVEASKHEVTDHEKARAILLLLGGSNEGVAALRAAPVSHGSLRRPIRRRLDVLLGRRAGDPDEALAVLRQYSTLLDSPGARFALVRSHPRHVRMALHAPVADDPHDTELIRRHRTRPLAGAVCRSLILEELCPPATVLALLRNAPDTPAEFGQGKAHFGQFAQWLLDSELVTPAELLLHSAPVRLLALLSPGSSSAKEQHVGVLHRLLSGATAAQLVAAARDTGTRTLAELLTAEGPGSGQPEPAADPALLQLLLALSEPARVADTLTLLTPDEAVDLGRRHTARPEAALAVTRTAERRRPPVAVAAQDDAPRPWVSAVDRPPGAWFVKPHENVDWDELTSHLRSGGAFDAHTARSLLVHPDVPEAAARLLLKYYRSRPEVSPQWPYPTLRAALRRPAALYHSEDAARLWFPRPLAELVDTGRVSAADVVQLVAPARLAAVREGPASTAVATAAREHLGPAADDVEVWVVALNLHQEFAGTLAELFTTAATAVRG